MSKRRQTKKQQKTRQRRAEQAARARAAHPPPAPAAAAAWPPPPPPSAEPADETAALLERCRHRPGAIIGRYELLEPLGRGGFGEVWRADRLEHSADGAPPRRSPVALKIPTHSLYIRHLRREGAILQRLQHPNVVSLLEVETEGETPFIAMEYVHGKSVRDAILREGLLEYKEVRSVAEQVLIALDYIHGNGWIHRDVKPENVLIAEDGTVKLIDFGLGHLAERVLAEAYVSVSMVSRDVPVAGTLAYMSPEQRRGAKVDARSDIYAFGVMLHEMLTDELPRVDLRVSEVREDLGLRFDVLLHGLLHPDPDRRIESAVEARRRLVFTIQDRRAVPVHAQRHGHASRTAMLDEQLLREASPYSPGQVIGEDLELVEMLGRGGFGECWVARTIPAGRTVAVKIALDDSAREGMALEAKIGASLRHPSIPRVHAARLDASPPHLVMDLVRGKNLWEHLREHRRFELDEGLVIFRGMLDALRECHAHGIVHRDLKPGNFIYDEDTRRVVLLDFGLASVRGADDEPRLAQSLATRAAVVGTPDYMAPEQRAKHGVGPHSDVYSLGVCIYEMLTGSIPKGQRLRSVIRGCPEWLDALVVRMLSRQPHQRPTVADAIDEIEDEVGALVSRGGRAVFIEAETWAEWVGRLTARAVRFYHEHPAEVLVTGLAAATLLFAAIVFYWETVAEVVKLGGGLLGAAVLFLAMVKLTRDAG